MFYKPYKRRQFLQNAALFSTSLITSLAHARLTSASEQRVKDESVKALVIGSGFGGAVAALRLGQAGINTVLLERGRRWPITPEQSTFATFQKPDGRAAWLSPTTYDGVPVDVYTGVLELKAEDGINVLCGAGFGGGSLVYNAIIYKPIRELFYKVFPHSINYEELDEVYYPRVHSILNPSPLPPDILATDYYDRTRLFLQQANTAGFRNYLQDVGVNWDIVREEINGTKVASAINGNDWYGMNSGAKKSLDQNYLAQAEQTGFVEILTLHMVTAITELPHHGYRVSCIQINETGEVVVQKSFTCRHLFLAAGSMGTSKLLVKAKATGTLPRLNEYVGKYWGNNGDTIGNRSNLPPVLHFGGPASAVLEDFSNPIAPIALAYVPTWNAPDGTLQSIGMSIPAPSGIFTYDASTDSVKLTWPKNSQENQNLQLAQKRTYEILDNSNATPTSKPTTQIFPDLTAHPLGGAVLGKACDEYGRVFGYRGLYVVDGALIPGSTGATNPAFTIAALAERCMDKIIADIY